MLDLYLGSVTMVTAAITGLWRYKKLEPRWLRLFTWFVVTEFIIQFAEYFYVRLTGIRDNIFIGNINIYFEYGSYLLFLYLSVKGRRQKTIIFIALLLFTAFYVYQVFIAHRFAFIGSVYNTLSVNVGEIICIVCCFVFLIELLMNDDFVYLLTIPAFWITTGIMIEIAGVFLYAAFRNYIMKHNLDPNGDVQGLVMTICNILEYGLFTIALAGSSIWKRSKS